MDRTRELTAPRKVFTLYVSEEAFAIDDNGSGVAAAIRVATAAHDATLASSIAFDAEAGGVSVGAPDRPSLERVIRIAVDAGVVVPSVLEMLDADADEVDEETWELGPGDFEARDPDGRPWPMRPHAVTDTTFVGSISPGDYRLDRRPWPTAEALAQAVRERVGRAGWADEVRVEVLHENAVTVEAASIGRLDEVARLVELPGISGAAAEDFERIRERPEPEPHPLSDPPWAVVRDRRAGAAWSARGVVDAGARDVGVESILRVYDLLEGTDEERGGRLDVRPLGPELVIAGERRDDVEWAAAIMRGGRTTSCCWKT